MRLFYPPNPQRYWLERNPDTIFAVFQSGALQGTSYAFTARYTVPVGRKFLLTHVLIDVYRVTAATTPQLTFCQVGVNDGISWKPIARLSWQNNVVGAADRIIIPANIFLPAGWQLGDYVANTDTGGTCSFENVAYGIEYDAG